MKKILVLALAAVMALVCVGALADITLDEAKQIALDRAGVAAEDALFIKSHTDRDDGRAVYDIEFYSNATEYEFDVDVVTGDRDLFQLVDDASSTRVIYTARGGVRDPDLVDQDLFSKHLYTADMPDPDLLIRTSGEFRISNFLLWQIAYSEIYVTDLLWPDFGRWELLRAIRAYQGRQRRFGGVVA